jgi:riboflavin kinase / FMN adenylyltransferase
MSSSSRLGARHVVVGDDFRYGSKACGTIESLRAAGELRGFGVEQIAPFVFDGVRVSSTAVRERLEEADYAGAARLLGRPIGWWATWPTAGARPRRSGFPTANLHLMRRKSPVWGIWRCGCSASTRGRSPASRASAPVRR